MLKKLLSYPIQSFTQMLNKPANRYYSPLFKNFRLAYQQTHVEELLDGIMYHIKACQMSGDYLEFGVFTGRSFSAAYHMARSYGIPMRFFAFDSFEGIPDSPSDKLEGFTRHDKGTFACDLPTFQKNLAKKGIPASEYRTIKGYFADTLTQETKKSLGIDKAAVVMIDSDIYEAAILALDFITDHLQDGTVIIFDEWFSYRGHPDRGERRAFREWTQKNNIRYTEFHRTLRDSLSFIIHK